VKWCYLILYSIAVRIVSSSPIGIDSITMSSLLQLGPWLAVEIPDLVEKGIVTHKEKTSAAEK